MADFSADEIRELRYVLAAFKADLPPHDLGYWYITRESTPVALVNDERPGEYRLHLGAETSRNVRIGGHAECVRCRKRFAIPSAGNFVTWDDDERIARTIATAKEWVGRDAERDGPCWGDVPEPPERHWSYAIMDSVAAMREP